MGSGAFRPAVRTKPRATNLAAAVRVQTAVIEVVAPTMIGDQVTVTVDATQTGTLTYVLPFVDPAGAIITAAPWTSPRFYLEFITPPPATSGVAIRSGMLDGTDPATDQLVAGGGLFNALAGPRAQILTHNLGPFVSLGVAGGLYVDFELLARSSLSMSGATVFRHGWVGVLTSKSGGGGLAAVIEPNANWLGVPHVIAQIQVSGASLDTAMQLVYRSNYLQHSRQTVLGG